MIDSSIDEEENESLALTKGTKADEGLAISGVMCHPHDAFMAYAEQCRMFDVRDALVRMRGVIGSGMQGGPIINLARDYSGEMHVITVLRNNCAVTPLVENVLTTIWHQMAKQGSDGILKLWDGISNAKPSFSHTTVHRPNVRQRRQRPRSKECSHLHQNGRTMNWNVKA